MQKKSTLFAAALVISCASFAQFQKGTVTANFNIGDIRYLSLRNKSFDKQNNLSFNPGVGYFIKNNWEVGVGLNYSSFNLDDSSHGGSYENINTVGVNVYSNYYFGKRKLKPYLSLQAGWNHSEGKYAFNGMPLTNFNSNNFYYNLGGGINWNISSRFSLFAEASFIRSSPFNRYGHGRSNITVGARIFFNNKKKR